MIGALRQELQSLGCSDHSCCIATPVGMGTNGGCKCIPHTIPLGDRVRLRRAFAILRELTKEE